VGTLPDTLRVASAVSSVVYAALALLAVSGPRTPSRQRGLRTASALFALGTIMNLASPSIGEKLLRAPSQRHSASCCGAALRNTVGLS